MREGIHPNYTASKIICACGNVIKTNSTKPEIKVDVCSKCHPFWTALFLYSIYYYKFL